MKVVIGRTKIELNDSEKDLLWAMYNFTNQYHDKNNQCNDLCCSDCPLALFCYPDVLDKEKVMNNIITTIEDHANG